MSLNLNSKLKSVKFIQIKIKRKMKSKESLMGSKVRKVQ